MNNYLWDSCVFIAYLNNEKDHYDLDSIEAFLEDAEAGRAKIFTSSIAFAEITPKRLVGGDYDQFSDFLEDFQSSVTIVDASPQICQLAGELKDFQYRKGGSTKRVLTTGDAIMFATALQLKDTFSVDIDALHTFDNGRGKGNPEGKGVPMLSFEEWCEDILTEPLIARLIALDRIKPLHPSVIK